jgi:hypothetical protein
VHKALHEQTTRFRIKNRVTATSRQWIFTFPSSQKWPNSYDTSRVSPQLEGVMMGTRSGDFDPAIVGVSDAKKKT